MNGQSLNIAVKLKSIEDVPMTYEP